MLYFAVHMEKMPRPEASDKALEKRQERVGGLVDLINELHAQSEAFFAQNCLFLLDAELTDPQKESLIQVICRNTNASGEQAAFETLHELPGLDERYRTLLFEFIISSGDRPLCRMTLHFVSNLGPWETKLRETVEAL